MGLPPEGPLALESALVNVESVRFNSGETDNLAAEVWMDGCNRRTFSSRIKQGAKLLMRFHQHPEAGVWEVYCRQAIDLLVVAQTKLHFPWPFMI